MYVRTGKWHYYTLQEKLNIVEQAYMFSWNVKPTARAYSVEAKQIRKWKAQFEAVENPPPIYPAPHTVEERSDIKNLKVKIKEGHQQFHTASKTTLFLCLKFIGSGVYV
jgi:transposase-like protein